MSTTVIKIRKIGKSKGILFDKSILNEVGIIDGVKITLKGKAIIITPADQTRKKAWSDFKKVKRESVEYFANTFDSKEWVW